MNEVLKRIITSRNKRLPMDQFKEGFTELLNLGLLKYLSEAFDVIPYNSMPHDDSWKPLKISGNRFKGLMREISKDYQDKLDHTNKFLGRMLHVHKSNDMRVYILAPFRFSEILVIELYDMELCDATIDAISHAHSYKDINDNDFLYGVAVMSKKSLGRREYINILHHEVTHYVLQYMDFVTGRNIIKTYIDDIAIEALADSLQFLVLKGGVHTGLAKFRKFGKRVLKPEAYRAYLPYLDAMQEVLDTLYPNTSITD